MNHKLVVLFFVFMVGCTPTTTSTSFSVSLDFSSTHLPENFEKLREGRPLLYEKTTAHNFSRENNLTVQPVQLLPENYRETEDAWVPYQRDDAPVIHPSFFSSQWNEQQFAESLETFSLPTEEAFVSLFNAWLPYDDAFVFRDETVYLRDLSHEFFNGDYYWFNNYIDQYVTEFARIEDHYVYGFAQVNRVFQTLNEISFQREHGVLYDETTIFALKDESFPFGFFGAVDQKIMTPRAGDNTKHALSLGPSRYLLNTLAYWDYLIELSQTDDTISPYSKQFSLEQFSFTDINLTLTLTQPLNTLRSQEYLEHTIAVQIRNLEWAEFVETEILWLNEDRV